MKLRKNVMLAASAVISFAIVAAMAASAVAQDGRPRYSGTQSGERGWTIPPDTVISVQMNTTLTSRTARVGDKFTATITVPVYANGRPVIPAGSIVEGRVTQVTPAKRMNRSGTIGIDFDDIVFPNGAAVPLVGSLTSDDPETRRRIDDESHVSGESNNRTSVFVGGGGAIGAVLGGIAGGGKGAVLGGAAGAGAGIATILFSKGEGARVPAQTPFGIQIREPLIISESVISEPGSGGDRSSVQSQPDQSVYRSADRPDRQADAPARPADRSRRSADTTRESVDTQPDIPDRPMPTRSDSDTRSEPRNDVNRSTVNAPALPLSSPEMIGRAQGALKEQGYYEGEIDGVVNPRTSGALRAYQREHSLSETGDLDPQTAKSLGILGATNVSDRAPEHARETRTESAETTTVMANVLSATAIRTADGAISVAINTQANTGGWRWVGEHVVNGDTLEVYARAIRPAGMVTQALTRGRIALTVQNGVEYVRRVVIHSAGADQPIALGGGTGAGREPSAPSGSTSAAGARVGAPASSVSSLHRKAEELLSEYQRLYGIRMTGSGIEVDNASQYREAEIELLFAIDSFVNAAQLYERLSGSLRERQSMRGATLSMARQARRTDRVISTTTSRAADSLASKWDSIRQDVLMLMQTYNINSSEIED